MGDISKVVSVTITAQSNAPAQGNYGTPACSGLATWQGPLVKEYGDLSELTDNGCTTDDVVYLQATAIMEQNPRPETFKVIKLSTSVVQTFTLTVTDNTVGHKVGFTMLDVDSSRTLRDLYTTVTTGQSTAQVATALAAVIDALSSCGASATGSVVTVTMGTTGKVAYPSRIPANEDVFAGGLQGVSFEDTTPSASVDSDLTAALAVDRNWYGFSTPYIDHTNIANAQAWADTNKRIYGFCTADTDNLTAGSGVGHTLQGLSSVYAFGVYTKSPGLFSCMGWMANRFTVDPGTDTWHLKPVVGAYPDDDLRTADLSALETNGLNYFTSYGTTLRLMYGGYSCGGTFLDQTRGLDAFADDARTEIFGDLASKPKEPYTSAGISAIGNALATSMARFTAIPSQENRLFSNDVGFQPVVIKPNIKNVSAADKRNRLLRNVQAVAYLAGAIHKVRVQINALF